MLKISGVHVAEMNWLATPYIEGRWYDMGDAGENMRELPSQAEANYSAVDITDDFMFAYVMQSPELCIELLEYLFPGHKIQKVVYLAVDEGSESDITVVVGNGAAKTYPVAQKTLAVAFGKKGIRMDVYLDDGKVVYNIEMQATRTGHLPKRSRYYAGQVDINQLNRGQEYDQLKPTYIIFICKFDPFGKGLYQYTFCNKCDEVDGLELGDESYKIFLNTAGIKDCPDEKDNPGKTDGDGGRISDGMKELLRYMNNTKDYPVESTRYNLIKKIDEAVAHAKRNEEWRRAYMTYQANQRDAELRGDERRAKESALSMYNDGLAVEKISKYVGYAVDVVKKWVGISV